MIYEDEKSTEELVDEILGAGDGKQDEPTPDGSRWDIPGEGTERATCRRCGGMFLKPPKSKRTLCPACFAAQVSAGMKASHAARRAKREARKAAAAEPVGATIGRPGANDRQIKTGNIREGKEAETMEEDEKTQWDQLEETAAAPEREPEEDERVMLENVREKNDVIIDIYRTVRSIARSAGLDPSRTVEALYEMDSIMRGV